MCSSLIYRCADNRLINVLIEISINIDIKLIQVQLDRLLQIVLTLI